MNINSSQAKMEVESGGGWMNDFCLNFSFKAVFTSHKRFFSFLISYNKKLESINICFSFNAGENANWKLCFEVSEQQLNNHIHICHMEEWEAKSSYFPFSCNFMLKFWNVGASVCFCGESLNFSLLLHSNCAMETE